MGNRLKTAITLRTITRPCIAHYERDGQNYVFCFRPDELQEALRWPGRMVLATDYEFSFHDSAIVCKMMRDMVDGL